MSGSADCAVAGWWVVGWGGVVSFFAPSCGVSVSSMGSLPLSSHSADRSGKVVAMAATHLACISVFAFTAREITALLAFMQRSNLAKVNSFSWQKVSIRSVMVLMIVCR